jgi:hypothetical protein
VCRVVVVESIEEMEVAFSRVSSKMGGLLERGLSWPDADSR